MGRSWLEIVNGSGIFLFEDTFVFVFERERERDRERERSFSNVVWKWIKWYDVAKVLKRKQVGKCKAKSSQSDDVWFNKTWRTTSFSKDALALLLVQVEENQ